MSDFNWTPDYDMSMDEEMFARLGSERVMSSGHLTG